MCCYTIFAWDASFPKKKKKKMKRKNVSNTHVPDQFLTKYIQTLCFEYEALNGDLKLAKYN